MAVSRLYDRPLNGVTASGAGLSLRPAGFVWKGVSYRVLRLWDFWVETGPWWESGNREKIFFRVETDPPGLFELYCDTAAGRWRLYRVFD